jgi:glycosyltransferase involved in cell wall biosynthesis
MRVSVVIPAYNCGPFIAETLESVLGQTLPPDEVVVVDDGSTDDTAERVAAYADRVRYVYQQNARTAAARNRGIAETSGELIAFVDGDDVWHPTKLQRQVRILGERPELSAIGTRLIDWPEEQFRPAGELPAGAVVRLPIERMLVKNYLATSSIVVRRELINRVGGFDTELHGPEDYDLWLRIGLVAELAMLELPLTGYRNIPGSLGKQGDTMRIGLARILRKLEAMGAWRGRWLLRRKAYSYLDYTCSYLFHMAGRSREACVHLVRSLVWYPLPYQRSEVNCTLARARLLLHVTGRYFRSLATGKRSARKPLASEARAQ